ncbi:hypothetical protein DFH08DRAFT_818541 [Mycena albidolilacea]|uniref:Novel STAND NTPase 1 domain-containing protein n=1 Tax=Mycena albidolilacea TaxID=1033008 RepID=A0AAD6ZGG4_9AGAR|nr:hypothetical protein DFH08DRAFT_818541 [Mycena albidolilacea]
MSSPTITQNKLQNAVICLTMTTSTLQIIADSMKTPFLDAIINTTRAVLKNVQLLEQIHTLLNTIVILHIKSDTGGEMPPQVLNQVGKFEEYCSCPLEIHYILTAKIRILHKIYTFVKAQRKSNQVRNFFRQGEIGTLLKDCQAGLQQAFDFFLIEGTWALLDITEMKKDAQKRHQEVLDMIEKLSDTTASERASTISGHYSWSSNSSSSISMLPSEPQIFHGRESEISDILHLFKTGVPRIAILGAGGMGKTSLARAVLHHPYIVARYVQNRFFVACVSATTKLELVNLIGDHLGLKPGKDLTWAVLQHFSNNPPSLLILDELEGLWEPATSRGEIEELLSLVTGVENLVLMITMRGAERPAKVLWTRPFLKALQPLDQEAAQLTFTDIADGGHNMAEVDQILSLTDNMPLAINLLSILSMLPDGLSDVDLIQSKLPLDNILECKTALKSTALAYTDQHKRLKVLMPIREYLQQHSPPGDHLIQSLLEYFQEMLNFDMEYHGTQLNSSTVLRIKSNFTNIQNVLEWGLKPEQPTLSNSIYCLCHLTQFSHHFNMQAWTGLIGHIQDILPQLNDHQLKAYLLTELIDSCLNYPMSDHAALASQAWEHLKCSDDADLKCRFYLCMAGYHWELKSDLVGASNLCKKSISLAFSTGNSKRQSQALCKLAWINISLGNYSEAQMHAYEAQKLARISGYLYGEADTHLLALCGMSGAGVNLAIMSNQAEVHRCVPRHDVQQNIDLARSIFPAGAEIAIACDFILGDLYLREQDLVAAQLLFAKCLQSSSHTDVKSFCLERLGNASQWSVDYSMVYSLKCKKTLQVHKGLQFFGDVFLHQKDEDTAISLFTVALEGFTFMDVHCSRAECMAKLGDISNSHGNLLKAVELWTTARPLFERSSQAQKVQFVDEKLAGVGSDVLEQHREAISHIVELNVPSSNPSSIKHEEQVKLVDELLQQGVV